MSELAQVGEVRECCGERYLLVEQQRGSLVRRWYAHADDCEMRPLAACESCAAPLLPHAATHSRAERRALGSASYAARVTAAPPPFLRNVVWPSAEQRARLPATTSGPETGAATRRSPLLPPRLV